MNVEARELQPGCSVRVYMKSKAKQSLHCSLLAHAPAEPVGSDTQTLSFTYTMLCVHMLVHPSSFRPTHTFVFNSTTGTEAGGPWVLSPSFPRLPQGSI